MSRLPESAKAYIKALNSQYPDATHHCWAYIVGNPLSTTLIGCSDDGEPSGTAGKPMLNVLQHADIGDIVAVCTRFYGGTKLGTGGLSRAYGGGVKSALEKLEVKEKIDYLSIGFSIDYAQLKDCEHVIGRFQTDEVNVDYQSQIIVRVRIAASQLTEFKQAIQNKLKGKVVWNSNGLAKHLHMSAAVLSFLGFVLRGFWMLSGNKLLEAKLTKVLPHIIDTLLLGSAIYLVWVTQQYPFVVNWVTAKVLLLVVYIVAGTFALKRGKTKKQKVQAFVLAVVSILSIFAIAATKPGLSW